MLTAVPTSWLSRHYDVYDGRDRIARLDLAWVREAGTLVLADRTFEVGRDGLWSGPFYLKERGGLRAAAVKPSALVRAFDVVVGPDEYRLAPAAWLGRRFDPTGGGEVIGWIRPLAIFTSRMEIDLPDALPLEVRVFLAWLVILLWRRRVHSS